MDEIQEEEVGLYLPLNNDDDNSDTTIDREQHPVIGENDLSSLIISASPSDLPGTLTLSWGSNIKLWETTNKDTEVTKTTYTASELPKTYYVEGYNTSNSLKDTQITLSYTAPDNTQYQDTAKITVFTVIITANPDTVKPKETGEAKESKSTITVFCKAGTFGIPGQNVSMSAQAQQYSGGHDHNGNRPIGTFNSSSGTTNSQGEFQTEYEASRFGGIEVISAKVNNTITKSINLNVEISGLQLLPTGDNYDKVGGTNSHYGPPGWQEDHNHWGTSDTISALIGIANDYKKKFPAASRLRYNDMSLPKGGLFDINGNWDKPHRTHRLGNNCDLSMSNVPAENRDELKKIIIERGGKIYDEGNHWHLTF